MFFTDILSSFMDVLCPQSQPADREAEERRTEEKLFQDAQEIAQRIGNDGVLDLSGIIAIPNPNRGDVQRPYSLTKQQWQTIFTTAENTATPKGVRISKLVLKNNLFGIRPSTRQNDPTLFDILTVLPDSMRNSLEELDLSGNALMNRNFLSNPMVTHTFGQLGPNVTTLKLANNVLYMCRIEEIEALLNAIPAQVQTIDLTGNKLDTYLSSEQNQPRLDPNMLRALLLNTGKNIVLEVPLQDDLGREGLPVNVNSLS